MSESKSGSVKKRGRSLPGGGGHLGHGGGHQAASGGRHGGVGHHMTMRGEALEAFAREGGGQRHSLSCIL